MKTSALRIFGTTALVAATLSACGGSTGPGAGANDAPGTGDAAATTSAVPAPTATPAAVPAPTATTARAYSQDELEDLVGQLKDARGHALGVTPAVDVAASLEQSKSAVQGMTWEPAECRVLALPGVAPSADGAAVAVGTSVDAASGAATAVSMTSGLDEAILAQIDDMARQLSKCATMSITAGDVRLSTNVTLLEGFGSLPGAVAFRTDSQFSDGRKQSLITGQVVQRGILLSVVASGGGGEQAAIATAGALLDSAAALIK